MRLTVKTDDGRSVQFDSEKYGHISHGYAVTTHKSQGVSVKCAYVLGGGSMASREMTYVQMSRFKEVARLFLNKKEVEQSLKSAAAAAGLDTIPPTEKMIKFAESISESEGYPLPKGYQEDFWACRSYLDKYSEIYLGGKNDTKTINGDKIEPPEVFTQIEQAIKQMEKAKQKETTLAYKTAEQQKNVSNTMHDTKHTIVHQNINQLELELELEM